MFKTVVVSSTPSSSTSSLLLKHCQCHFLLHFFFLALGCNFAVVKTSLHLRNTLPLKPFLPHVVQIRNYELA